jgi:type II secretory pathway component PulK
VREPRTSERGVALLVAVLSVALLTVTVMELTYTTQVGYRRTVHWVQARRARLIAESGLALAAELLSYDSLLASQAQAAGRPELRVATVDGLRPESDFWAQCVEPSPWTCTERVGAMCTLPVGASALADGTEPAATGDGEGAVSVRIEDETGLYNLNRLYSNQVPGEYERLGRFLQAAGLDPSLAGPIADWVDSNSVPLGFPPGAEAQQYLSEDREEPPRNGPFVTFRELALVLGIGARELVALRRFTTVLEPGIDRVNVNTAPLPVLQALGESVSEDVLAELHAERCKRPFVDEEDLRNRVADVEDTGILPLLAFTSNRFRVRATGRIDDVYQSVEAILAREGEKIVISYFLGRRGPNIRGVDTSQPASAEEIEALARTAGRRL